MPLYGINQAGSNSDLSKNLTCVEIGDTYTLFDGTETSDVGTASVAFARGTTGSGDNGITFQATSMAAGYVIDVQSANQDLDAAYTTVAQLTPDASGNANYTDVGRSPFWRVKVTDVGGSSPLTCPVVNVQR